MLICKSGTSNDNKILQTEDWMKNLEKTNTVFRTLILICVNVSTCPLLGLLDYTGEGKRWDSRYMFDFPLFELYSAILRLY